MAIGFHGGSLYNSWWMTPPAAMMEIKPVAGSQVFPNGDLFRDFAQLNNIHFWFMTAEAGDASKWSGTVDCKVGGGSGAREGVEEGGAVRQKWELQGREVSRGT